MTELFGKSPKMWVNELCAQQGALIHWQTLARRDAFESTCTVSYTDGDVVAKGQGQRKILAEQNAAADILFSGMEFTKPKIYALNQNKRVPNVASLFSNGTVPVRFTNGNGNNNMNEPGSDTDADKRDDNEALGTNPVGALQEAFAKMSVHPEYKELEKDGPDHEPYFTIQCSVGQLHETARRSTKKQAKAIAAHRALKKLKANQFNLTLFETNESNADDVTDENGTEDSIESLIGNLNLNGSLANSSCTLKSEFTSRFGEKFQFLEDNDILTSGAYTDKKYEILLDSICRQSGIILTVYEPFKWEERDHYVVLKMKYPFENYSPYFSVVEGKGEDKCEAIQKCALEALSLLYTKFIAV
ncbi:Interferon-inducible double-stranded RNA-dependent protein kinase activator A B [Orchesella cincta]|uniref:Interferon-inducible double-stranded RNA-dependent protein kinase activator A B n=1 Tax=Orchesella cincta TaxID=48709 RepID=A0A1D2NAY4_ORCCI|nr:Interferon-inducible double-stranded RNA-dependent protein kinase activator A B [Orchesella cincta]